MVADYTLSRAADRDLTVLVQGSLSLFGLHQTDRYVAGLHEVLNSLAEFPDLGASFLHERSSRSYRHHPYGSHVIYYRRRATDILIVRILHAKMLPSKHL
jgi:toxin ParE1/3/4